LSLALYSQERTDARGEERRGEELMR